MVCWTPDPGAQSRLRETSIFVSFVFLDILASRAAMVLLSVEKDNWSQLCGRWMWERERARRVKILLGDRRRAWLQRRRRAPSLYGDGDHNTFQVKLRHIGPPLFVHRQVGGRSSASSRRQTRRLHLSPTNRSLLRTTSSTHFLARPFPPFERGARLLKSSRLVLSATYRTRLVTPM